MEAPTEEKKIKPVPFKSMALLGEANKNYWDEVHTAHEKGKKVVWSTVPTFTPLLDAMGFATVYPENYAGACAAANISGVYCEYAENMGYTGDLCGYARNSYGSQFSGRFDISPTGVIPKPDLIVAAPSCHTHLKWFEEEARLHKAPFVAIEMPMRHDFLSEAEFEHYALFAAKQLEERVPELEVVAGEKLDIDKLKYHITIMAEVVERWTHCIELAKAVPAPASVFDLFKALFIMSCRRAQPDGLAFIKAFEAELEERIKLGISAIPNEQYRIYWGGIAIWHKMGWLFRKFANRGVNVVGSSYVYSWVQQGITPERPFEGAISGYSRMIGNWGVKTQADFLRKMFKEFKLDGAVWQVSRTCKPCGIGTLDWFDALREFGPVMPIESDMCDFRSFNEAKVDEDLNTFLDILTSKPPINH